MKTKLNINIFVLCLSITIPLLDCFHITVMRARSMPLVSQGNDDNFPQPPMSFQMKSNGISQDNGPILMGNGPPPLKDLAEFISSKNFYLKNN